MRNVWRQFQRLGTGHDSALWPVLLLLLIVLVPSAGVVWMMRAAMDNERLAVRQRLADAYHAQLEIARRRIDQNWRDTLSQFDAIADHQTPQQAFAECVMSGLVDSVIILDDHGQIAYPAASTRAATAAPDDDWKEAEFLEFKTDDSPAADAYRAIAAATTDKTLAARARQSEARVLSRAGKQREAIEVLQQLRQDDATDSFGRSLAADAELRLVELLDDNSDAWREAVASLAQRLNNYTAQSMPPEQRRFLMHALHAMDPTIALKTLSAEDLAADISARPLEPSPAGVFQATSIANISQLRSPSGRVIALMKDSTLENSLSRALAEQPFPAGVVATARGPNPNEESSNDFVDVWLAPLLPRWKLALGLSDAASFDTAANARTAFFLWTGVVVVAITAALALLVANMLRKQSRLARLKNDLVATVSHELKTPLASIRLLVDTLLDADGAPGAPFGDSTRAREYLEMIATENARLSRLIDNFLTFSRMERGKHRFDFRPADGAAIVEQAAAAVIDRFDGETNTLSVDIERPLPIVGDPDMLVTVVTNLLDNTWKYTEEPKRVQLAALRVGDQVVVTVSDNGIGLSPWAARRVFDRFYQVDQQLSRTHGGCGLGLSIVKYIVEAHGGVVSVESRVGAGTKFVVSLPADVSAVAQRPAPAATLEAHR